MEKSRTVDLMIPTCRPDGRTIESLKRMLKQSYPVNRIFIINTKSDTFMEDISGLDDRISVIHIEPEQFDHGGTRNRGAMMSEADFILFMTQDALPVDEYLVERLMETFEDERVGAAYARQLPNPDCSYIEKYTRSFNYPAKSAVNSEKDIKKRGIKTFFCSNVCAVYRKSVYESLGGFETHTIFNEDMIMAAKIICSGYKVCYAAEARVIHSHNYNWRQQFRRNFDLAVSQAEHPEIFEKVRSESEGIRLVKQTAVYLIKTGHFWLIPSLVFTSGFKFLGYRLGKVYKRLPRKVVLRCTMNPGYWKK